MVIDRYNKNRDEKQCLGDVATRRKSVATCKNGTNHTRTCWHIPENSNIYKYLDVSTTIINIPIWKRLDAILAQAESNKENECIRIYDDFVKRISVYYPDKEIELNKLRPLILKRILKGHKLEDSYYDEIRKL